jgi:hypothetical protein
LHETAEATGTGKQDDDNQTKKPHKNGNEKIADSGM